MSDDIYPNWDDEYRSYRDYWRAEYDDEYFESICERNEPDKKYSSSYIPKIHFNKYLHGKPICGVGYMVTDKVETVNCKLCIKKLEAATAEEI